MVMGDKADGIGFRISSKRLPTLWTQRANRLLDKLFGFETFNAAFRAAPECPDSELAQAILDALGVRLELSGASKDVIPRDGALVVVCNHPFGIIDGLAIDAVLQSMRSDVSVIAAHWLAQVPRLRNSILIVVGAQGAEKRRRQSVAGWLTALQRLKRGGAVIVFPAGQAARFRWRRLSVADLPWSPHVASVIRKTSAGVVPVFFEGRNSRAFYVLTAIFPGLANFLLARECLKKSNAGVRAVIGQPIASGELSKFRTDEEAVQFLRRTVEALARQGAALA
jgi:putative hemolysin